MSWMSSVFGSWTPTSQVATNVSQAPSSSSSSKAATAASADVSKDHGESTSVMWQNLAIELVSMTASYALLFFGLRYFMKEMDPMRKQKDDAKKHRKRLEQKLIQNGRAPFVMDEYETIIASDLIYPEDIDVNFSMIGGLEHVKQEIFDIVALPLRRPDLFQGRSRLLAPPKGILLYGPPGTGKTMMAKAIAKESGAAFINLQMSTTMNKWFGESQKLVRATFSLAWKLAPCVIFIDEIDSFLRERQSDDHAAQGNMKAEFMALWDGLTTQDVPRNGRGYGVIVIGATNRPYDVDSAILRRMPRTFKLALPTLEQRQDIFGIMLKGETLDADLSLNALAQLTNGYSGSDIKELCSAAAMIPFREFAQQCREANDFRQGKALRRLKMRDFLVAMKDVKATGHAAYEYQEEVQGPSPNDNINPEVLTAFLQAMAQSLRTNTPPVNDNNSNNNLD